MRIGPFELSAIVHRGGADASVYVRRSPDPVFQFTRQRCVFAVWWARGCDMGLTVWDRRLFFRAIGPRT